jgi:hypothetical protein
LPSGFVWQYNQPVMDMQSEKKWLRLILLLFLLVGGSYAVVTPVFEASDELWHYPMIRHLADGNPLPVQVFDPAQAGPWKQEASQPPLYYYLGALLTFWVDSSDMAQVRWENPHVDNGILTADGNINLVIHDPGWSPWQGTLLAVRIVRLFSVLLGAATVFLTYLIGKELLPQRQELVLTATAVLAFTPMFLFISGAVNNDNLAIPLTSLGVLLMIRMVKRSGEWTTAVLAQRVLILGAVAGLAILTKQGALALLPLSLGTLFIALWRRGQQSVPIMPDDAGWWRRFAQTLLHTGGYFLLLLLPVALIAGWWYWRNVQLYGDWLGWNAFIAVLGQRAHPASIAQLWSERWGFMLSFWGLFGGVNVPMAIWIYHLLNGLVVLAIPGFLFYLAVTVRRWWRAQPPLRLRAADLLHRLFTFVADFFPLVILLLLLTAVIFGLVQWATTTWSSQGRLVFTAISAVHLLWIVGLLVNFPARIARAAGLTLAAFMFGIAAVAPWVWIQPSYQPGQVSAPWLQMQPLDENFNDQIRLVGMEIGQTTAAQQKTSYAPGDTVDLLLAWEVLAPMRENWSVFVHLNDPILGVPIAQRDMFLDQGLRPTSLLQPGEKIYNYYQLRIPETAIAPVELELATGLYDFNTFARLPLAGGGDVVNLARLPLTAQTSAVPNPLQVTFEGGFTLVGFALDPRRTEAGEMVNLTLFWEAEAPVAEDYTFFAQVVSADTTRWGAQDLPLPTSSWQPGELHEVTLQFPLREDTPADVYPLIIGLYTVTEGGQFNRLQRIAPDGRPTDDLTFAVD